MSNCATASAHSLPANNNKTAPTTETVVPRETVRVGLVCDRHWDELGEVTLLRGSASAAEGADTLRLSDFTGAVASVLGFGDLDAPDKDKEDYARLGAYVCPISISVAPTAAERASEDGPPPRRELPLGHTVIKRQYGERRAVGAAAGGAPPLIDPPLDSLLVPNNGNGSLSDGCKVAVRGAGCPEAAMGQMAAQLDGLTWHGAQTHSDVKHLVSAFARLLAAHERLERDHEETKKELAELRGRCLQLVERGEKEAKHQAAVDTATRLLRRYRADYSAVIDLVMKYRDVSAATENGSTPLHIACTHGHTEIAKSLIAADADVDAASNDGSTALTIACAHGHTEIVKALIAANVNVNAVHNGRTPLHIAYQRGGNTDIVMALIAANANVNATPGNMSPLLHMACIHGHTEIVRALIAADANVNAVCNGTTPLHSACTYGRTEIVKALIAANANVNVVCNGTTALHIAYQRGGNTDIVMALIAANANVNATPVKNTSPLLHIACTHGHTEIAKALIAAGASVNALDMNRAPPLHIACMRGHTDIAKALIAANADVNAVHNGTTPLFIASQRQFADIANALLLAGARSNFQ